MKSAQLAEYAKLVDGPGNCGEHREAIKALLLWTHDLECKIEILTEQAGAKNDLRIELHKKDLHVGELQKAARALLDKLNRSWVGKDYAEYAFSEDAKSHPMADLEKLLTEKPKCLSCQDTGYVETQATGDRNKCGFCNVAEKPKDECGIVGLRDEVCRDPKGHKGPHWGAFKRIQAVPNEHCKNGPKCAAYDCDCECQGCRKSMGCA